MSAATDRMADEAMVRVQAHIALATARAHVAIHFQAESLQLEAQGRYHKALKDHRRSVVLRPLIAAIARPVVARLLQQFADAGVVRPDLFAGSARGAGRLIRDTEDPLPLSVVFLGGIAVAMALGWLGPAIDAQPDRREEWLQTERELQAEGTLQLWEQEARTRCAALTGENGAYILVDGGGIVCTDKRGHRAGRPL